jgi:putative transposase
VARQCELLGLSRSGFYRPRRGPSALKQMLLRRIDELHMDHPFYGSRQLTRVLRREGHLVNRKRVQKLMKAAAITALYPKRKLSAPNKEHRVYPYLLKDLVVTRPNQVWATDITYIPVEGGQAYLCAVLDWHSRCVLAWEISNTLDASFCVRAVNRAIERFGIPAIFNTDQGCQFTSLEFTQPLLDRGVRLSMDGTGRCLDNVFVERLWRTVKYEEIYARSYDSLSDARKHLAIYFEFYNQRRPHSSHDGLTPWEVYHQSDLALAA